MRADIGNAFAIHFFNMRATLPRLYRVLVLFIAYIAFYTPFIFMLPDFLIAGFVTANLNPFLFNIVMVASGVAPWRAGNRSARYFLLAVGFSILGIFFFLMGVLGVVEYSFVMDNALAGGYLLEMIFLSLTMADKINLLREEKDRAQTMALAHGRILAETLLRAKEELEIKVEERTAQLSASRDQAEQATKLKDKFVSLVSHDLRSPLGSILGMVKLVDPDKTDPVSIETNRSMLKRISRSAESLLQLIDQLLNLSRLKTGNIKPVMKFFDAHTLSAITLANFGFLAEKKGIKILNDIPKGMRIHADPNLFGEVIGNLVSNAVKFCSHGDQIILLGNPDKPCAITVKDTGPGVHEAFLPDLFQSEVKTTSLGSGGEKGTGLGLPYCHDIMTAHGGSISVDSKPGQGAAFHICLPEITCVILIVDDQEAHRMMMKKQLSTKIDAVFLEADNGEEALKIVAQTAIHLIITDIRMPVMDGFEFLSALRAQIALAHVPVIVATSGESSGEKVQNLRKKVFDMGGNDFVIKPVQPDDFLPRVLRFIG